MMATNILWDVENSDVLDDLPEAIKIPDGILDEEMISDYISNMTGFCHEGFCLSD